MGTGSGYQTTILARLARRVYTVERHKPLLQAAEARFEELKLRNITSKCGDGTLGWEAQNPFDRVIVTAAASDVPPVLADQLTLGGVMVVPIGYDSEFQTILRVVRIENGFDTSELRDVRFVLSFQQRWGRQDEQSQNQHPFVRAFDIVRLWQPRMAPESGGAGYGAVSRGSSKRGGTPSRIMAGSQVQSPRPSYRVSRHPSLSGGRPVNTL